MLAATYITKTPASDRMLAPKVLLLVAVGESCVGLEVSEGGEGGIGESVGVGVGFEVGCWDIVFDEAEWAVWARVAVGFHV